MDGVTPAGGHLGRLVKVLGALLLLAVLVLGALWVTLPDPSEWSTRNPPTTALIEQRRLEAAGAGRRYQPDQRWLPLAQVSRRLSEAVVAAEDAKFWGHGGFDWEALEEAARHNLKRHAFARGASTITQQLAKNLYFGTRKSLLRKAREAMQSARLERRLGKRRILELYLNVAEWGDGIFGIEAAARHHLGVGAAQLDTAQAVLLASMLPAPRRADLTHPAPWLVARARGLLDRLHDEKALGDEEHRTASAELLRLLGISPKEPPAGASEPLPEPPADDSPEPATSPEPSAPATPAAPSPTLEPTPGPESSAPAGPAAPSAAPPSPEPTAPAASVPPAPEAPGPTPPSPPP